MLHRIPFLLVVLVCAGAFAADATTKPSRQIPRGVIPDCLGVNIHFTDEKPGELAQIAAAGIRLVRMDCSWSDIEREKGVYDFAAYDSLLDSLDRNGLRAMLILDYASPHYDDNRSPDTNAGREAFARFAGAAAKRYRGRGVIWEIYNEPNIARFWRPTPNVEDYVALALATAEAVREADPEATIVGPACSGVDLEFLEACFAGGLLEHFDAITVHPYTQRDPENAAADYRALRVLLRKYKSDKPIVSGEWGYSIAWVGQTAEKQAKLLARQWLFNLSQNIAFNIWYDWRDDGTNAEEPEHNFGIVPHDPAAAPKSAYVAAKTLAAQLDKRTFNKRIWTGDERDHALLFQFADGGVEGGGEMYVVWTTSRFPREIELPAADDREFSAVDHLGNLITLAPPQDGRLRVTASDAPIYIKPAGSNDAMRLAAAWPAAPLEITGKIDGLLGTVRWSPTMGNPFDQAIALRCEIDAKVERADAALEDEGVTLPPHGTSRVGVDLPMCRIDAAQKPVIVTLRAAGFPAISQRVDVICDEPWIISRRALSPKEWMIEVLNPAKTEGSATFVMLDAQTSQEKRTRELHSSNMVLNEGGAFGWRFMPWPNDVAGAPAVLRFSDGPSDRSVELDPIRFELLDFAAENWKVGAEGDEKTTSQQSIGPPISMDHPLNADAQGLRVEYEFAAGWKYALLQPKPGPLAVRGEPIALGLWVRGDGSGNVLRCRFTDSAGQTFQPDGPRLTFHNWRYVEFSLDGTKAGHWGGNKTGVVNYPISIETLLLVDSFSHQPTKGAITIATPALVFRGAE